MTEDQTEKGGACPHLKAPGWELGERGGHSSFCQNDIYSKFSPLEQVAPLSWWRLGCVWKRYHRSARAGAPGRARRESEGFLLAVKSVSL